MFFPEGQIRVRLYGQPCDMRKSFDGLQALVRQGLHRDPLDDSLYVFVNRRGVQMRVLYFDRSGFCIWAGPVYRGLDSGTCARDGLDGIEAAARGDRAWEVAQALSAGAGEKE
jgi:hypothetical protein